MKIAGAPISWGMYEVPGWGFQMNPGRVLSQMVEPELTAAKFGPQGWLPTEPEAHAAAVKAHGLTPVGAFFLAVMHDPDHDPILAVKAELEVFRVTGGSVLVLVCDSGREGYDSRPVLDEQGWATLHHNLGRIAEVCAVSGVTACVHPHWGTMIQNADEVGRILDETGVGLCLDTGHLMADGADPVDIVRRHPERVAIVYAEDVHKELADKLLTGEPTWNEGIRAEMFTPIGDGDVDFATIVSLLNGVGFDGYWVLEQDIMLDEDPALGEGPIHNTRRSFKTLKSLAG